MGTNSEKIQYDKSSPLQKKLAETDICELSFKEWLIKKQFQMTTTMRRKESKLTSDISLHYTMTTGKSHLHIKAESDKKQSTKICSVEI